MLSWPGPERSGSTWLFNAVRLLYEAARQALHPYWLHTVTDAKLRDRNCGVRPQMPWLCDCRSLGLKNPFAKSWRSAPVIERSCLYRADLSLHGTCKSVMLRTPTAPMSCPEGPPHGSAARFVIRTSIMKRPLSPITPAVQQLERQPDACWNGSMTHADKIPKAVMTVGPSDRAAWGARPAH